jgi:hypothetical protein
MVQTELARYLAESASELLVLNTEAAREEAAELMNLGARILSRADVAQYTDIQEAA